LRFDLAAKVPPGLRPTSDNRNRHLLDLTYSPQTLDAARVLGLRITEGRRMRRLTLRLHTSADQALS
jgi:hypothetical protein